MARHKERAYEVLGEAKSGQRIATLSRRAAGGYTLAQKKIDVDDSGKEYEIFFKGGIHLDSEDAVARLRDMLDAVIGEWNKKNS